MLIHELTPNECREILKRTNLGRLACARDNQPYIIPIYFDFDGDYVYSFATQGQKIEWMRANPKVCMEVDDIVDQFHWTTVVVLGRYEELPPGPDHEAARRRAQELFQKRPEWWLPGSAKLIAKEHHTPVVFRISVGRLSGRRAAREKMRTPPVAKKASAKAPRWWTDVLAPVLGRKASD
jgi:nitroimidazol reductase NimA-like FMN-containing flavoprotein (pyridoxamine 5'-phosphate oxidase superfamily)